MQQLPVKKLKFKDIVTAFAGFQNARSDVGDTSSLKESISRDGLEHPLTVWAVPGKKEFLLLDGYRRHDALTKLRMENPEDPVPFEMLECTVYEGDLDGAMVVNLRSHIEDKDLNPADEAEAVARLITRFGRQEQVAEVLHRSQPWVSTRFALYTCLVPEALRALRQERITLKQAKRLHRMLDRTGRPDVARQLVELEKMLGGEKGDGAEPAKRRERVVRTAKDFARMMALLLDMEHEVDDDVRAHGLAMMQWCMGQVDDDAALNPLPLDTYVDQQARKAVAQADDGPKKKRRRDAAQQEV